MEFICWIPDPEMFLIFNLQSNCYSHGVGKERAQSKYSASSQYLPPLTHESQQCHAVDYYLKLQTLSTHQSPEDQLYPTPRKPA